MSTDASTGTTVSPTASARNNYQSRRDLPKMTTGTSEEYVEKMASAVSHAMLPNPTWRLIFNDGVAGTKLDLDASEEERLQGYQSVIKQFVAPHESGAFIAEAGDFSACASWWPPGSHEPPKDLQHPNPSEQQGSTNTLMAAFERETEKVRTELIWSKYGQEYWHLALIGRDPRKPPAPGCVRAVLQPFIELAAAERKPIWLNTTNSVARDMYLHFGWDLVKTVTAHGLNEWCMILYPPSESNA